MNRTTFVIAAALTAFVLVIIGGVTAKVYKTDTPTPPTPAVVVAPTKGSAGVDPAIQLQIQQREQAYQQQIEEANQQLKEAYQSQQQLRQDNAQLIQEKQMLEQQMTAAQATVQFLPAYKVLPDQAQAIAKSIAPASAAIQGTPELVDFEGTVAYEVVFDQGKMYVDANSGAVVHNGVVAPVVAQPVANVAQPVANVHYTTNSQATIAMQSRHYEDDDHEEYKKYERKKSKQEDHGKREHDD